MAKKKTKTKKPIRLRQILKAIKQRRVRVKPAPLTQADYVVALDRVVRAISRSVPGQTVVVGAVRVL